MLQGKKRSKLPSGKGANWGQTNMGCTRSKTRKQHNRKHTQRIWHLRFIARCTCSKRKQKRWDTRTLYRDLQKNYSTVGDRVFYPPWLADRPFAKTSIIRRNPLLPVKSVEVRWVRSFFSAPFFQSGKGGCDANTERGLFGKDAGRQRESLLPVYTVRRLIVAPSSLLSIKNIYMRGDQNDRGPRVRRSTRFAVI